MAHFVSNFVAMTTSVGRGRICLTSFNSPTPKTPCWTQRSPRYLVFKPSYSRFFFSNIVAIATGVGRGRRFLASFNSPTPKTPVIHKDLLDISYTSRVMKDFVSKFVSMATAVGRGSICLTSFNSAAPKTPSYMQISPVYLLYKASYSRFCPKFRCRGNRGWSQ